MKRNKNVIDYDKSALLYFNEITKSQPLERDEEYELWKKYKEENDIEARNKLVSCNLKFVASIAKHYQGMGLSYNELISEGNCGLIRAIDKFDGNKGFKLISYSVWWIRQAIVEAIKKKNVMDADDLPINDVEIEDDYKDDSTVVVNNDFLFDEEAKQDKADEEKKVVGYLMNFLSDKEKNILTKYYGLDGSKPKTLEEIGKELGISKERVRQINAKSFIKMRSAALMMNN